MYLSKQSIFDAYILLLDELIDVFPSAVLYVIVILVIFPVALQNGICYKDSTCSF